MTLFLESSLPFQWISVVEGGFDACYDVVQQYNSLGELVDFDADRCRPARYYRYKKLEETRPKAALILKNHALNSIFERTQRSNPKNIVENDGGSIGGQTRLTLSSSSYGGNESSSGSGNTHGVRPIFEIGSGSGRSWKNMFTKRRNSKTTAKATAKANPQPDEPTEHQAVEALRRRSWSGGSGGSDHSNPTGDGRVGDGEEDEKDEDEEDDEVESAIIAAMEAVEMTQAAESSNSSSSSTKWFSSMGSRWNRAVTSFKVSSAPLVSKATKQRRKSSPASSRPILSEDSFSPPPATRTGSTTVDVVEEEEDYSVDTPAWDQFTLTPKAPPPPASEEEDVRRGHRTTTQDHQEEGAEEDGFPIEITQHSPTTSLNQMRSGDVFVETDFTTSLARDAGGGSGGGSGGGGGTTGVQWFQCEFVPNVLGKGPPPLRRGWTYDEYLLICSQHLMIVRVWQHNPSSAKTDREKMVEKAKQVKLQAKKAAKRFGRWMSSLKSPSTEGSGSGIVGDAIGSSSTAEVQGNALSLMAVQSASPTMVEFVDNKNATLVSLPSLVSVEVFYPIADITKMTRKKKNPHVVTLYFQKTISVLCSFDDPTECTKALKQKCYDLKMNKHNSTNVSTSAAASSVCATVVFADKRERPQNIPVTDHLLASVSPPNSPHSPQADSNAFSFGGETDSDDEEM